MANPLNMVSDPFAYDISKDCLTKGEVINEAVISLSIENILMTMNGERVFMPLFGSPLSRLIFDGFTKRKTEQLATEVLKAIEMFEDRIVIDKGNSEFTFDDNSGTLEISIPYVIIRERIASTFNKRVVF